MRRLRPILVNLGATLVVGACVVAALVLGSPSLPAARAQMPDVAAGPPPVDPLLPTSPGSVAVTRGSTLDGRRMNVDIRFSPESVETLARHYQDLLARRGIEAQDQDLGGQHFVGGLAPDGHQVGVVLRPVDDPGGPTGTLVIPISARGSYRPGAEIARLDLPLPPHHVVVSTGRSHAGGTGATTAEVVVDGSAAAARAFYRKAMAARGFVALSRGGRIAGRDGGELLRFRGPDGDLATVGIHTVDASHAALFLIHSDHPEVNRP